MIDEFGLELYLRGIHFHDLRDTRAKALHHRHRIKTWFPLQSVDFESQYQRDFQ